MEIFDDMLKRYCFRAEYTKFSAHPDISCVGAGLVSAHPNNRGLVVGPVSARPEISWVGAMAVTQCTDW